MTTQAATDHVTTTTVQTMTPRQRWAAAMHMQPVDYLPFWPKLGGSNYMRRQREPFRSMTPAEVFQWIGSERHDFIPEGVSVVQRDCRRQSEVNGDVTTIRWITPLGELIGINHFDHGSNSWHPVKFPVQTEADIDIARRFYEDQSWAVDEQQLVTARQRKQELGEAAYTQTGIGESAFMHWIEWLAGVENAHYLLADHTDSVTALFEAIHQSLRQRTRLMAVHSVADCCYMIENTSTTLISVQQYRDYCFDHLLEYATIMKKHGRALVLHMCGHLKLLLPHLAKLPVRAFEAFTSPTVGNATFLDGRTHCPDTCLIGGTNANLWLQPLPVILAEIRRRLDELPHHRGIIVTSAGVMPPACPPETIREVCRWVHAYPARM